MAKDMETRLYKIPDADLKQLADALAASITRDLSFFSARLITSDNVTKLNSFATAFDACTTDQELLGAITIATEVKDDIAVKVRKAIRPIRNMAELTFEGKGKYNTFGFDELSKQTDNELYRMAKRIVRVASQLQNDLATQGLQQSQITELDSLATQLDTAIDGVEAATEDRDLHKQERIIKGNILWAEMVKLASIGRSLFEDTNEALYNDYVLITNSSEPAQKTMPVEEAKTTN